MYETGLGTLDQLRIEMELNFLVKRIPFQVDKKISIDSMLVLPTIPGETSKSKDQRVRVIELQLEETNLNSSRDHSHAYKSSTLGLKTSESLMGIKHINVVLFCQPNAQPYEMIFHDPLMLKFFLDKDYHVILWNYRGYGRSQGSPSMEVI